MCKLSLQRGNRTSTSQNNQPYITTMNVPYTAAEMGELIATVSTAFTKLQTNAPQNVMYITDYKVGVQTNGHLKHSVSITSYTTDEDGKIVLDENGNCVSPEVGNIFVYIFWTTDTEYNNSNDWNQFKLNVINELTKLGLL